jgi:hypothetical protein
VTVTEQLDPNLDWGTFQLGDFGFGDIVVSVPAGRTSYSTRVDATATLGVLVDVDAELNLQTGVVTWTFTALDPTTLDLPMDPLAGLLPPNQDAPEGQGFVTYTVNPRDGLATGTRMSAQATVVFDTNAPIDTPLMFNTADSGPPASSVQPLPAFTPSPQFLVQWGGQDDAGGSGIAGYDVYVSDNGGPFTAFLTATTQTAATFTGQAGHTYAFSSVATDNVGNREADHLTPDAVTRVGVQLAASRMQVNGGDAQRSNVETLSVQFNQGTNLQALIDAGTITAAVQVVGAGVIALPPDRFRWDAATNTLTVDLTVDGFGGSHATILADGRYTLRLDTSMITAADSADNHLADDDGTPDGHRTFGFHRLLGDFDGNGVVDLHDRDLLFDHFGSSVGQPLYSYAFDLNGDGTINISDYLLWTRLLGHRV